MAISDAIPVKSCHDDLWNKTTETVLKNCSKTSGDAAQAPHDYRYFINSRLLYY